MRDRKGNDITPQFTGKLRQLFCIVLQRGSAGISSRHLSSILWPDRPEEETKNVRGVTVNKLRKLLSQMDGISLVSREKRFYLETAKPFWCDYLRFQEILDMRHPDMDRLVRILSRGRFLTEETDPVYDKLKESVESRVEPIMTAEMQRRFQLKHYSVCLTCADVIFGIDPLNEDALSCSVRSLLRMERSEEAKALYNRFISRYSRDYGEAYPYSYESLTGSSTQQTT